MFPEPEGQEAKEGTVAHDYAAAAINGHVLALGERHENGLTVTAAMIEETQEYIQDCKAVRALYPDFVGVEKWCHAHTFIHPDVDGTPDFYAVFLAERRVILKDFKFGRGYVNAFRNFQVAVYLISLFETLGLGIPDDSWTIEGAIYQPRNYHPEGHVRYWRPKGSELELMRGHFAQAAAEAKSPGALCRVGTWCRYCTGIHACTVNKEAASFAMGHAGKAQVHLPDVGDLGRELRLLVFYEKILKARKEALEEQVMAHVARGERVPFWRGAYVNGRTAWKVPIDRAIAWCGALGVSIAKPAAMTPTQALKLGLTPEHIEAITHTPSTYGLVEVTQETLAKGLSENG